ncbi:MAG: Flagellin protein FlaA [Candidatus Rifleibacterium amylolyticum]|nr:MAG: Flagellin protein FlaA [Candidatus Rifleibacterium amylolyticum]
MALRINSNVTALNAHSNLVKNDNRLSSSIERLSSGLRINRASDDAAGLTISEKLRTQVRGITRARMNVQDGISLIQTAEGALNEIHSMLQRMRELALQSGNDTLTTTDRLEIQKEIAQLKEDINRISYGTEFNTRKLLDGSGTAVISSSDPKNLDGVVVGEVLTFSDFSVVVWPKSEYIPGIGYKTYSGTPEHQRSAIFVTTDGEIATSSTTLASLANFYDKNNHFILDLPQTLFLQGDNSQGEIVVSKDLTLGQLTERIQAAMTLDQLGKGLDFEGSQAFISDSGDDNGQITVISGRNGELGRINFTGEESLVKALGFQAVIPAEDPVYSIAVTNLGVPFGERNTLTTQIAGHRAMGLIEGIDLMFEPPQSANAVTKAAVLGISIPSAITFDIDDSVSSTLTVPINIGSGVYSMQQVASIINTELRAASSMVTVRVNDQYALEFTTLNTGSAAYVSITNATTNPLGVSNGRYTGTGGNPGVATGYDIIDAFDFSQAGTSIEFSIADRHDVLGSSTIIRLTGNYTAGGLNSLVEAINLQIGANGLLVTAEAKNGVLAFRSLETGVESNFDIFDTGGGALGIAAGLKVHQQTTISGFDGNSAVQNFAYDQPSARFGYVVFDHTATGGVDNLSFYIADLDGNGMSIAFPAGSAGTSFRSITEIANQINAQASLQGVKVNAEILTATQTIRMFSTIPGRDGRIVFAELGSPDSTNTLKSIFDVDPVAYQNGSGNYAYTMHVKDTQIQFQIGPNQGHTAVSNIIRTDCKALGIEDLDLTTVKSSEIAIGLIDKALQRISSERAKLGAIENRMNYTLNSLSVALQNMTASESRIRDVDMAAEVIEMTSSQILQQASNAMVGQANVSAQAVLDLLR